jgi:NAD(P)H-hydrate repair Nnr-like enzyme with NAD(P)H-hydrate dehydratase domain
MKQDKKVADSGKMRLSGRNSDSHKGQNRLVLVTGGFSDYVCAPVLSGKGAGSSIVCAGGVLL